MDLFDLGDTPEAIAKSLAPAQCRWLFLSFSSDWLYPAAASQRLVDALVAQGRSVSSCVIESPAGHDSFLLEDSMVLGTQMISSVLAAQSGDTGPIRVPEEPRPDQPTNIFFTNRLDYGLIIRLMPECASIVDLGCGNGELLSILRDRNHAPLLGIERDARDGLRRALGLPSGQPQPQHDLDHLTLPVREYRDVAPRDGQVRPLRLDPGIRSPLMFLASRSRHPTSSSKAWYS